VRRADDQDDEVQGCALRLTAYDRRCDRVRRGGVPTPGPDQRNAADILKAFEQQSREQTATVPWVQRASTKRDLGEP